MMTIGWRVIVTTFTLVLLTSKSSAKPSLLPGDPRLSNTNAHHHDHHHDPHHDHTPPQAQTLSAPQVQPLPQAQTSPVVMMTPYVLNPDGSYAYRYQLADGSFAYVNGNSGGSVSGGYGYRGQDGQNIQLQYTAGVQGFVPTGAHLPVSPEVPTGNNNEDYSSSQTYSASSDDDYYDEDADRSYQFDFEADGYNRNEAADQHGNVQGTYSYVDASGVLRSLTYSAGAGTGFVAQADFIPRDGNSPQNNFQSQNQAPVLPIHQTSYQQKGYSQPKPEPSKFYSRPEPSQLYSAPAPQTPNQLYAAPPKAPEKPNQLYQTPSKPVTTTTTTTTTTTSTTTPMMMMDASYAFGFDSEDSSRREVADAAGNVRGQYSYVNAEGKTILVQYRAGAETGFVIENEKELAQSVDEATNAQPVVIAKAQNPYASEESVITYQQSDVDEETWKQIPNYSFGYSSSQGSRQEESDADGKVRGSYSLLGADGNEIVVRYSASAETGFVIENLDEVMAASVPSESNPAPASVPAPAVEVSYQAQSSFPPALPQPETNTGYSYNVPQNPLNPPTRNTGYAHRPQVAPEPQVAPVQSQYEDVDYDADADRSYAFAYSGDAGDRKEEADQNGNVKGQYSYVNAEGNKIVVQYSATPEGGFVIENQEELTQSVEKATQDGAKTAAAFNTNQQRQTQRQQYQAQQEQIVPVSRAHAAPQPPQQPASYSVNQQESSVDEDYDTDADRSYAFAYSGDAGDRREEADQNGNVKGQYSYVNAEGNKIVVQYSASPEGGFVIENQEELTKSVEKATQDGAQTAAAFNTNQQTLRQQYQAQQEQIVPVSRAHAAPQPPQQQTSYSGDEEDSEPKRRKVIKKIVRRKKNQGYSISAPEEPSQLYHLPNESIESDVEAENKDRSFSFGYRSEDLGQEEVSDVNGERTGSYRYVNPEGEEVVVKYKAGRNGFEILNPEQVLPQAPQA